MPWSSQALIASIIIVQGDQGGVFIYNSAGVLVDSMAFQANVDPQTSSNLAGITSYQAGGLTGQLISATLNFALTGDDTAANLSGSGGTLTINSGRHLVAQTISVLQMLSSGSPTGVAQAVLVAGGSPTPHTGDLLEVQGTAAANSLDVYPAATAPPAVATGVEPWNYVGVGGNPAFGTGWSNFGGGFANLAFRFVAAPSRCVQIKGEVTHTATASQTIFTLPVAYRPVSNQQFTCISNGSGIIGMEVSSAGLVELLVAPGAIVTHNVDLLVSLDI